MNCQSEYFIVRHTYNTTTAFFCFSYDIVVTFINIFVWLCVGSDKEGITLCSLF